MENPINYYPIYDDEEAIGVIMDSISDELLEKLSEDDINIIIDLKFEYLESINLVSNPDESCFVTSIADMDEDAMDEYVITNAIKYDIYLSIDELHEIWNGDEDYLEMKGLIGKIPLEEMN